SSSTGASGSDAGSVSAAAAWAGVLCSGSVKVGAAGAPAGDPAARRLVRRTTGAGSGTVSDCSGTVVRRTADAAGSGVTVGAGAPAGAPATRRRLRPLVSSEPGGISCEESGSGVWVLSAMRPSPSEGPSAPWLHVVIVPEDGSL